MYRQNKAALLNICAGHSILQYHLEVGCQARFTNPDLWSPDISFGGLCI